MQALHYVVPCCRGANSYGLTWMPFFIVDPFSNSYNSSNVLKDALCCTVVSSRSGNVNVLSMDFTFNQLFLMHFII